MSDGIDIGDIPLPDGPAEAPTLADNFDFNVALKFAFVGVGQCGGRIAHTFHQLGYARCCAVNTTVADLAKLPLEPQQKLDLGGARGAAKDPDAAAALFADKDEDLFDFLKANWGAEVEHAFVCLAAAGGTGAGGSGKVIEVVKRYMEHHKQAQRVGVIVSLPQDDEGPQFAKNALRTVRMLRQTGVSPVILIDNQKIRELFRPKQSVVHETENNATARLLHLFNRLAGTESDDTSFDRAEFARLLDSGVITFAADTLKSWATGADITTPIRDRLRGNVLATVDYARATVAGLIYVLNGRAYDEVLAEDLGHGTAMFTRLLARDSTVFTGVYKGVNTEDSIKALAMIGGLPWPAQRISDLAQRAGVAPDEVGKILGV